MKRAAQAMTVVLVVCTAGLIIVFIASVVRPNSEPQNINDALDLAFQPHPGARLALDASLVNEGGHAVALGDYFGKSPVILVLEYLRCTSLCGVTLHNLIDGALNKLPLRAGRDYELVAISIDPRDKPADAAAARSRYGGLLGSGEAGLHFLTAEPAVVDEIADTVGFRYRYQSFLDAYIHPTGFVVVSQDGTISRYVEGIAISPEELLSAFADAQQGKSPGLLARIVLLCGVHGAPLGGLTAPVMAALMFGNFAAGLTLIALFTHIRRQG